MGAVKWLDDSDVGRGAIEYEASRLPKISGGEQSRGDRVAEPYEREPQEQPLQNGDRHAHPFISQFDVPPRRVPSRYRN